MEIAIREMNAGSTGLLHQCDGSFTVEAVLKLDADDERLRYTIVPVAAYEKYYDTSDEDYRGYAGQPDRAVFFAFVQGSLAGQIVVRQNWNRFAYIDDIAVDVNFRRRGVGRALMDRAVDWARERSLPGVMLETQNINAGACQFYARYGFELGGFDRRLYHATLHGSGEIALFWYLIF